MMGVLGYNATHDAQRPPMLTTQEPEDTRRAALQDAQERRTALHALVLGALSDAALTADEVADQVGESPLSIRPRMTELKQQGKIVKTALRRRNKSGKMAVVWMLRE